MEWLVMYTFIALVFSFAICWNVSCLDISTGITSSPNYTHLSRVVIPLIRTPASNDIKQLLADRVWHFYQNDMQSIEALRHVSLQHLLFESGVAQRKHSRLYHNWINVLKTVDSHENFSHIVIPEIPSNIANDIKQAIAQKAWTIYTSPLIPNMYNNVDEINRALFRSDRHISDSYSVNSCVNIIRRKLRLRQCLHVASKIVHGCSVIANIADHVSTSVRDMRYTRTVNNINSLSVLAPHRWTSLANIAITYRYRTIPPVRRIAFSLQIIDVICSLIDMAIPYT